MTTFRTGLNFSKTINLRGHMPRFTLKMNIFPSISLETHKCVIKQSEQGSFFLRWLIWESHALVYFWNWRFSNLSPKKPHKCVLKPSEQGLFFWDNWFEGHMPFRFTLKMNVFPSIFLENPQMCDETIRTGLMFCKMIDLGAKCLGLIEKWMFSHLSPWKPHKCVLKPSEQAQFSQTINIWGVTCLGLLWNWMFSHLSS